MIMNPLEHFKDGEQRQQLIAKINSRRDKSNELPKIEQLKKLVEEDFPQLSQVKLKDFRNFFETLQKEPNFNDIVYPEQIVKFRIINDEVHFLIKYLRQEVIDQDSNYYSLEDCNTQDLQQYFDSPNYKQHIQDLKSADLLILQKALNLNRKQLEGSYKTSITVVQEQISKLSDYQQDGKKQIQPKRIENAEGKQLGQEIPGVNCIKRIEELEKLNIEKAELIDSHIRFHIDGIHYDIAVSFLDQASPKLLQQIDMLIESKKKQ